MTPIVTREVPRGRVDCHPDAPADWQKCPFGEVVEVNPLYPMERGREYPFLEMAAVKESFGGIIAYETRPFEGSLSRFNLDDTLFAKITPCAENGKVAFVDRLPADKGCGSTEFIVLSPRAGFDPFFVHSLAISPAIHSRAISRMEGSTGRLRVTEETFKKWIWVSVPNNRGEQTRIAETLKAADNHIRALEEQIRKAERVKKALLCEYFVAEPRRRNEPEETRQWKTDLVRLTKCGAIATGGTPERSNPSFFCGDILWVKSGEVDFNFIESTEEHITPEAAESINGNLYPIGTVLVAMYGAGVTRGRTAILAKPAYVNQAIASIECNSSTNNRWLFYWFQRNYHRVRGFAGGANQDNLNLYLLQGMKLSRPEYAKQQEIAETLVAADSFIRTLYSQLTAARRLKQSLLQNLLTGKIRLKG